MYQEAVELTAYLCKLYNIDPNGTAQCGGVTVPTILCHADSHKLGLGSNHGDVLHWFPKFGKSMATVRADVAALLAEGTQPAPVPVTDTKTAIWDFLYGKLGNAYGTAGLMGNLYAESALHPNNLQNTYERSLGMTDEQYTAAVDDDSYGNFAQDSAGYGLAQWTFWSRKQALLDFAKAAGKSIGDLQMQLEFLWKEIQGYTTVLNTLKTAASVREASDAVLTGYERPANQGDAVREKRAGYGQGYFDKYAGAAPPQPSADVPFLVRVTIPDLNIRKGPGTDTARTGKYTGKGVFTIMEVRQGVGSTTGWGRLKSGAGWISLDFCSILR